MNPVSPKPRQQSGMSLLVEAVVLALLPVLGELMADGGPAGFGKPETGYAMVFLGLVCWPWALILLLIGLKRLAFPAAPAVPEQPTPVPAGPQAHLTDAWADLSSGPTATNTENKKGEA